MFLKIKNSIKELIKTSKHSILKSFFNGFFKPNIHILTWTDHSTDDAGMTLRCETMTLWNFHIQPPTFSWDTWHWPFKKNTKTDARSVPVGIVITSSSGMKLAYLLRNSKDNKWATNSLSVECLYPAIVFAFFHVSNIFIVKYILLCALPHAFRYSFLFAYIFFRPEFFLVPPWMAPYKDAILDFETWKGWPNLFKFRSAQKTTQLL